MTSCEHFHFVAQLKVSQKEKVHLLGGGEVMRSNSYIQKIHKIESANKRTTVGDIAHSDVAVTQDERDVPGREEGE